MTVVSRASWRREEIRKGSFFSPPVSGCQSHFKVGREVKQKEKSLEECEKPLFLLDKKHKERRSFEASSSFPPRVFPYLGAGNLRLGKGKKKGKMTVMVDFVS